MPGDQPQRTWRDGIANPAATGGKRGWQQAAAPAKKKPWSRKTKLGIAAGLTAALLGLKIWVIQWLNPPKPACLVLIGSGYEENLTFRDNALGQKCLDDLA